MSKKISRIILDTDVGSDPDDATAISLAMKSPEIVLEGITTVYGDVDTRTRLAAKLLKLGGREDVRIYSGLKETLLRNRNVWWAGHEGEGVLDGTEPVESAGYAVDFIIDTIMGNPGNHRDPSGMTVAIPSAEGNVDVCLDADSEKFIELLLERLSNS